MLRVLPDRERKGGCRISDQGHSGIGRPKRRGRHPLCAYNLDAYQAKLVEKEPGFQTIPVLYLTQVLALCAGIEDENDWSLHAIDPRPMLEAKGLLSGVSTG